MTPPSTDQELELPPDSAASTDRSPRVSRRAFFTAGASIAAASLAATPLQAQQGTEKRKGVRGMVKKLLDAPPQPSFDPFRKNDNSALKAKGWDSALSRLVRHITNGVTPEEMTLARKLGYYGYLNYHLNYTRIDDAACQAVITQNYPALGQDANQLYSQDQGMLFAQLVNATFYRAAFSKRQLYERMVEFWSDHFNIQYVDVQYLKIVDDREVIRKHALGKFPDMLKASAHSPAMLEYLDNTRNRRPNVNQNYAREIMELHTLGVDGGYTQQDVAELSRVLSGWTMGPRGAGFIFDPNGHDYGAKVVMGINIPASNPSTGAAAKAEGDQIIEFLVNHASTAKYVSKKMLRWLLQYDPSQSQIDAVAAVYTRTKGDIPSMIRAILTPSNLTAAPPKYRRPYSFVLAAMRATSPNVSIPRLGNIASRQLVRVGQPIFAWGTPDGYPDRVDYWAGGVQTRWNFANYLMTNTADAVVDVNLFMRTPTPDGVASAISSQLFGGEMPDRLRQQLLAYLQAAPLSTSRVRETVALALGSSTFQWI